MNLIIGRENSFNSDTLIYEAGDNIESIAYIINGSAKLITDSGEAVIYKEGEFIAFKDLFGGFYLGEYYAMAGCRLMAFPADDVNSFIDFLKNNPEIHKKYYYGLCSVMDFLYRQYDTLYTEITNVYNLLNTIYTQYTQCCNDIQAAPASFLMPHESSLYKFDTQSFAANYKIFLNCYKSGNKLSMLYEKNPEGFIKQQINLIQSIYTTYEDMIFFLKTEISLFSSNSQDCLFYLVSSLMEHVTPEYSKNVMRLLNNMKNVIVQIDKKVTESTGLQLDIDYNRVNFYFMMASNATLKEPSSPAASQYEQTAKSVSDNSYVDFSGTLLTLCNYAKLEKEDYLHFNSLIEFYIEMPDKASRDDDARAFRRDLSNMYFLLYEKVFFNYVEDKAPNKIVELFLDYGLLDERLLTDDQLEILTSIKPLNNVTPCRVYRMRDWLTAIYTGKKMPSKNEFDKDYTEYVRDRKREEHLSPAEETKLLNDNVQRVKYEIKNMLKYNCRILNGNMLAFTPMLSMYDFEGDLNNFLLTSEQLNDAVNNCISIDYSAFYREQMYSMPEKKINKEVIQLQVFPDIILFPVYGVNGVMWQDLSGKRSNTSGRFFFPAFFRGNINDTMITTIGRFRWELCKSIMGTAWNNVSVPSITAEYSDYVQFYRKNRELSSDKKEALKNQLSRCRNNTREVFIMDYFIWIKYESTGAVRLNKVARQMLSTYCPFPKKMRAKLATQPLYEEAIKRFNINQQKKSHEIAMRIHALERSGAEITKELYDTQEFYSM